MITLRLRQTNGSTETYDIVHDDTVVGMCQLRYIPSKSADMPEGFENHIYYEINPEYQKQGFATEAVRQLLLKAKKAGLPDVVINIAENNEASRKVAEKNGTILLEKKQDSNGITYCKYIISLK
jgi:predicted acetyltransferase